MADGVVVGATVRVMHGPFRGACQRTSIHTTSSGAAGRSRGTGLPFGVDWGGCMYSHHVAGAAPLLGESTNTSPLVGL